MIKTRHNVFETNSSSTHCISFVDQPVLDYYPKTLSFTLGQFGWSPQFADHLSYLYTAILDYYRDDEVAAKKIKHLKKVMKKNGIKYSFYPEFTNHEEMCKYDYYIDHATELGGFLEDIFSNDVDLLRYLIYGEVACYNDNDDCEEYSAYTEAVLENPETKCWIKGN